jgi:hypothetical protein
MTPETRTTLARSCWILLLTLGLSSAYAQTAQEIAKKAFGLTVLLVMEDSNGQPLSLGSGFCVSDGAIASNLHVIEGATRGYAKLIGEKRKYEIEGIAALSKYTARSRGDEDFWFPLTGALAWQWRYGSSGRLCLRRRESLRSGRHVFPRHCKQ